MFGRELRHDSAEKRDEACVHHCRYDKDVAPAVDVADPAGEGASQEDAEKEAGHYDADGAAALLMGDEIGCDGEDDVGDRGQHSDYDAGSDEPSEGGSDCNQEEADGYRGVHPHHQGATLEHVAERNEEQKAKCVADLGCHGYESGMTGCGVIGVRHRHEKGLAVVDRRYTDGAG